MSLRTILFVGVAAVGLAAAGCENRRETAAAPEVAKPAVVAAKAPERGGEPVVRVRIEAGIETITFDGPTKLEIHPADQPDAKQVVSTPLAIRRTGGQWAA